jgi:hypothetical protein
MDPILMTGQMSDHLFDEVIAASPRKVREMLFSRLGIKPKKSFTLRAFSDRKSEQNRLLHRALTKDATQREADVCKELIRAWLYTKRPLLKSALDFLGIPNDDGLVEVETDFFKELKKDKAQSLVEHLYKSFPKDEVNLYLNFVEVPFMDELVK